MSAVRGKEEGGGGGKGRIAKRKPQAKEKRKEKNRQDGTRLNKQRDGLGREKHLGNPRSISRPKLGVWRSPRQR